MISFSDGLEEILGRITCGDLYEKSEKVSQSSLENCLQQLLVETIWKPIKSQAEIFEKLLKISIVDIFETICPKYNMKIADIS